MTHSSDQEGLPAYWGIETCIATTLEALSPHIRKDYPLIGVLKPITITIAVSISCDQEGLPAYWGIETDAHGLAFHQHLLVYRIRKDYPLIGVLKRHFRNGEMLHNYLCQEYQEGLPAYWGIETTFGYFEHDVILNLLVSGRITRLLGY